MAGGATDEVRVHRREGWADDPGHDDAGGGRAPGVSKPDGDRQGRFVKPSSLQYSLPTW